MLLLYWHTLSLASLVAPHFIASFIVSEQEVCPAKAVEAIVAQRSDILDATSV